MILRRRRKETNDIDKIAVEHLRPYGDHHDDDRRSAGAWHVGAHHGSGLPVHRHRVMGMHALLTLVDIVFGVLLLSAVAFSAITLIAFSIG